MKTKSLLLFVLALWVSSAASAYDAKVNGIYYDLSYPSAKVTYASTSYNSYSNSVVIPPSVTYSGKTYSVTSIGPSAFRGSTGMTSVTIPSSVTDIGDYAFQNCTGLTSVNIPGSVTSIGEGVFYGCSGLTTVTMVSRVTSIPEYTFNKCVSLENFTIPSSVITIERYAFSGCSGLSNISIPTSVTTIKYKAFDDCSNLTSVTLPPSITTIESYAFSGCAYLTSINIPKNVRTIGENPVYGVNGNYYEVYDDEGDATSYYSPFYGCSSLRTFGVDEDNPYFSSIDGVLFNKNGELLYEFPKGKTGDYVMPSQVKAMNVGQLWGCDNLTSITFSESFWAPHDVILPISGKSIKVLNIGKKFDVPSEFIRANNLPSLETITVDSENTKWWAENGVLYTKDSWCDMMVLYPQKKMDESYSVPEGVKLIGYCAVIGNVYLKNVTLPSTLSYIDDAAFKDCTQLREINIPSSVEWIADEAFYGCTKLNKINLSPNNHFFSLGARAFYGCTSLKTIVFGEGWCNDQYGNEDGINFGVFYGCNSVEDIYVKSDDLITYGWIQCDDDAPCDYIDTYMFNYFGATVHVPSGSSTAFRASDRWNQFNNIVEMLPVITFADANVKALCVANWDTDGDFEIGFDEAAAVTSLGEVFKENAEITSFDELQYFTGLTSIDEKAFFGCSNLQSVTFPEGLTEIGASAFEGSGLTSVKFPSTMDNVQEAAFLGCNNLSSIDFNNAPAVLNPHAFTLCPSLEYVYIPKTVQLWGWGHFFICENLKTVVSEANDEADWWATGSFDLCPALETISVPNVRSMGGNFVGMGESLQSVTILGGDAPDGWKHYANTMNGVSPSKYVKFIIPDGMAEAFLKHGYANLSDLSALPIVKVEFEAEAARIVAMAENIGNGDSEALSTAIATARAAVNDAEDYVTIYNQIAAIKAAARAYLATATLSEGTYVTAATITNPDIERYDIGWTISGGDNTRGYNESSYYTNDEVGVTVDGFIEAWHDVDILEDGEIWQTLPDLPAGRYRLEVDAIACRQMDETTEVTGVSLFAGSLSRPMATEADKPQSFFLEFENPFQKDVRIGVRTRNTTANWIAVDNFRLIYIGPSDLYMPESITSTSSETDLVYLYNVETGKFLNAGNSLGGYHAVLADTGLPFHLTQNGDGYWLFYFPEGSRFDQNLYWAYDNAKIYVDYNNSGEWTRQWLFTETDGAYTLQFREQEGSDYFLGNNPARKDYDYDYEVELDSHVDVICTDDVNDNIHWLLFSEEQYQRFMVVDELSVPDVRSVAGGKVNLPVNLSNPKNEVAGVQFEVTLPEGVTLNKVSTASRTSAFNVGSVPNIGSTYTVLLYNSNIAIPENDGKILTLELLLDGEIEMNDYTITISEIVLSAPDQSVLPTTDVVSCTLTVAEPERGDANCDGKVNVADIVDIANYILNNPPARFNTVAANVNGDSKINVADIVGVANIILSSGGSNSPGAKIRNTMEPE